MGSNTPIYLVSVPRSGATLLAAMLNSHKNIAMFNEPWFSYMLPEFESLCQQGKIKLLVEHLTSVAKRFGVLLDTEFKRETLREIENLELSNPLDVLASFMERYAKNAGKCRWGIKQPFGIFYVPGMLRRWPNLKIIHIFRDPRATVAERINKEWDKKENFVSAVKFSRSWSKMMLFSNRVKQLNSENYCELRYEDLVTVPEVCLGRVCEFVREDYDPGMLEYYKAKNLYVPREEDGSVAKSHLGVVKALSCQYVAAWKNLLTSKEISIVDKICQQAMTQRGYYPIASVKNIEGILYLKTVAQFWWAEIKSFVRHLSFIRMLYKVRNGLMLHHN